MLCEENAKDSARGARALAGAPAGTQGMEFSLCALAALAVQVAALDSGQPLWQAFAAAGAWALAALVARRALGRRRGTGGEAISPLATALLILLAALPFVQARLSPSGLAPEIVLLLSLRNLGLGLAALPGHERARRLGVFISLCLVTFAVALGREGAVLGVAAVYAAVASAWLASLHWSARLWSVPSPASTCRASAPPWGALAAAVLVVAGAFGAALAGAGHETTALRGAVPGSGGTGRWSFDSRGGVHDEGDAEVGATKDAWSVGFVDTDVFIESKQTSLYDTFADTYGAPKPPKEKQRKVVVPFQNFIERHTEPAENNDADQQFSTRRTPPRDRQAAPRSREAKALIYVRGRVPLHLKMTAYDRFDGEQWHREPVASGGRGHDLEREAEEALNQQNFKTNSSWLHFASAQLPPYFGGSEEHHIKIGTLRTDRVLAPGRLERFRIGRIDRPDFFFWAHQDILRFDAPRFPPATTFVTHSRMSDPRRLASHKFESAAETARRKSDAPYLSMPGRLDPLVAQSARLWARGTARGWGQIEAIASGLKSTCRHDSRAVAPVGCPDPVAHFLRSKRGPDYLFATTAVLALRSLGYPARLVSGFYARPERFLERTGHTLVQPEDAHFWAEVLVPRTNAHPFDRSWIPVEPTPGYELLPPQLTTWERALAACSQALEWARRHAAPLALVLVIALLVWRRRSRLADACATLLWRACVLMAPRRSAARQVAVALRLLDARGRRAGCPRPPGATPSRWLAPLIEISQEMSTPDEADAWAALQSDLRELLRLADHAAFAPLGSPEPCPPGEARALCHRAVAALEFTLLERGLKATPHRHPAATAPRRSASARRTRARLKLRLEAAPTHLLP